MKTEFFGHVATVKRWKMRRRTKACVINLKGKRKLGRSVHR